MTELDNLLFQLTTNKIKIESQAYYARKMQLLTEFSQGVSDYKWDSITYTLPAKMTKWDVLLFKTTEEAISWVNEVGIYNSVVLQQQYDIQEGVIKYDELEVSSSSEDSSEELAGYLVVFNKASSNHCRSYNPMRDLDLRELQQSKQERLKGVKDRERISSTVTQKTGTKLPFFEVNWDIFNLE